MPAPGNLPNERPAHPSHGSAWLYWIAGAATLIAIVAAWRLLPLDRLIEAFADWVRALGPAGLVAFVLAYVVTVLAIGPAWTLSVAAGVAFGFWAIPLVLTAAMVAAAAGFVLARRLGRQRIEPYIRNRPRIDVFDQSVQAHGFKAVLLLRLSPAVPFGAKGYLLGLTGVAPGHYLAGTLIGILPGTSFYVYLGALGQLVARDAPLDRLEWALVVLGLVATAAVVVIIGREAQRRLRDLGL